MLLLISENSFFHISRYFSLCFLPNSINFCLCSSKLKFFEILFKSSHESKYTNISLYYGSYHSDNSKYLSLYGGDQKKFLPCFNSLKIYLMELNI